MEFTLDTKATKKNFSLIYREEEYSFDIEPSQEAGFVSIMINNLYLEINEKGEVLYLWGLCPLLNYKEISNQPQNFQSYNLKISLDEELIPGLSYRLNSSGNWPIYVNKKSKWVCIGDPNLKGKKLIEFAPDSVASLDQEKLMAIWLHLEKFPRLEPNG